MAAGAYPLQGAGAGTVLRTTPGGRPPPRVPFVSASCREQAQTMLKRLRRPRERTVLQIELLEPKTKQVSNHRSPDTFAGFQEKHTFRAMHAHFSRRNKQVARDAGHLPTAGWQVWPRERTRCKGQAPERCCERPLAVDHHRAHRSCPRAAESKPKQCVKASGGPGSE